MKKCKKKSWNNFFLLFLHQKLIVYKCKHPAIMKYIHDFILVNNFQINKNFSLLTTQLDSRLPEIKPGQFVEIRVDNASGVMLRRPVSIHDVDYTKNQIKLLIQNIGKGTEKLCELKKGELLNMIYPLGNGFPIPTNENSPLLTGGGCGIAPLFFWGKYLSDNKIVPKFLIGAKSGSALIQIEKFKKIGETFVTTEDGSNGHKGLITNHPVLNQKKLNFDIIYACGPEQMMKSLAEYAKLHEIDCYVSLENRMACGIGACLCCIVSTVDGNKCTCVEGPVFNSKYLLW